jgi:hypothetical protein
MSLFEPNVSMCDFLDFTSLAGWYFVLAGTSIVLVLVLVLVLVVLYY